jgi:Fic family protein
MIYNWQQPDWSEFRYDLNGVEDMLFEFAELTGHVSWILKALPEAVRLEALIDMMVAEAIKTSVIEGECFDRQDIILSIRNNPSLNQTPEGTKDKMAQGAGELMADARKTYTDAFTAEKLFRWHTMLLKE